eukprot:gnl/MRDRNA2_/MRDRNA2_70312_c0_seq1.p1 gnl/MRDRNA2_/MRDRNA2_70312_c0~~gnl/MRDRNA2_/MRDRNA2_70312_c0_seq1.p1  ORF type:complete len:465 (+),score=45.95 gnl/MRDRNA2_/MRDRNA2_70312_c0_seq1:68-1462(+)
MFGRVFGATLSVALFVDAASFSKPTISILQRRSSLENVKHLQEHEQNAIPHIPLASDDSKLARVPVYKLNDKLIDSLVDQALKRWPLRHLDLDNSTLVETATSQRLARLNQFFLKNYMRFALTCAVFFGLTVPSVGQGLAGIKVCGTWAVAPIACLAYIFFLQGASLKVGEVKKSFTQAGPLLFGLITNLLVTPLMSILINFLTFLKQDLRTGFAVFCNLVVTLTPGISLTTAAGGNTAFSLLLIVITNIIGIFTIPFFLPFQLNTMMGVKGAWRIDPFPILYHLLGVVLVPTLLGAAVGQIPGVHALMARPHWKTGIAYSSQTALALMPWMATSLSSSGAYQLRSMPFLLTGLVAAGIHSAFLMWSFILSGLLRFPSDIRKSLTIVCSQKTLPLSMMVISLLPLQLGSTSSLFDKSTMGVPCVMGLVWQFLIDSSIVPRMAAWCPFKPESSAPVQAVAAVKAA